MCWASWALFRSTWPRLLPALPSERHWHRQHGAGDARGPAAGAARGGPALRTAHRVQRAGGHHRPRVVWVSDVVWHTLLSAWDSRPRMLLRGSPHYHTAARLVTFAPFPFTCAPAWPALPPAAASWTTPSPRTPRSTQPLARCSTLATPLSGRPTVSLLGREWALCGNCLQSRTSDSGKLEVVEVGWLV